MYSTLHNLLNAFLPSTLLQHPTPPPARGGWRGLLLTSSGSFFTGHPFETELIRLVERCVLSPSPVRFLSMSWFGYSGKFDFVVALSVRRAVAPQAAAFFSTALRGVVLDPPAAVLTNGGALSAWDALLRACCSQPAVFDHTPAVIAFKERYSTAVECRQIARHNPPFTAWGVVFDSCKKGCAVLPSDITIRTRGDAARSICLKCGWKSPFVRASQVEGLHDLGHGIFWHSFPPSLVLRNTLASLSAPSPN